MDNQLTERQKEIIESYERNNRSDDKVAKELGIDRKAVRSNLYLAAKKGYNLAPDTYIDQAPAGFELTKSTLQIDADGNVIQRWDRVSPIITELSDEFFNARVKPAPISVAPASVDKDTMLEWVIPDHHLGMLSWRKETGADYDVKIARELMIGASEVIFSTAGPVESIVIAGLGDNVHSDNKTNMTAKGKNILDVDTRHPKIFDIACETWCTAIDIALQFGNKVTVILITGNHDLHVSYALSKYLAAYYRLDPRVEVDTSPKKHKFYRWGRTLFMYSHSDTGGQRLAPYMLNYALNNNMTDLEWKYLRLGHLHKRGRKYPPGLIQEDGVFIEYFPTLAPNDAWAEEEAYMNIRATIANRWHKTWGDRGSIPVGWREIAAMTGGISD